MLPIIISSGQGLDSEDLSLFNDEEIGSIHAPIGIKLGGKSAPEIALSIVAQLVSKTNKLLLNSKG